MTSLPYVNEVEDPLFFASFSIVTTVSFSEFLFLLTIATSSAYAKICVLFVPVNPVILIF